GNIGADALGAGGHELDDLEPGQPGDRGYRGRLDAEGKDDELDLVFAFRQCLGAGPDVGLDAFWQALQGLDAFRWFGQPHPCPVASASGIAARFRPRRWWICADKSFLSSRPKAARRSSGTRSMYSGCLLIQDRM